MSKIVELNKQEFERWSNLVGDISTFRWQDLRVYFQTEREANDPGSAGGLGDYMYENNGDCPPSEPWVEYWLSDDALQKIWDYIVQRDVDILDCIMYARLNLHEFSNVYYLNDHDTGDYYRDMKAVSRKRVWKDARKKLAKLAHAYKIWSKLEYYCNSHHCAVKDPETGYLITEDGSIITENTVITCAL